MIGKIQAMLIVVILSFASCVGFVLYQNFSLNPDNLMKLVGIEGEDIIYVEGTGERKDYIVSGIDQKINNMGIKALLNYKGAERLNGNCTTVCLYIYTKEDVTYSEIEGLLKEKYENLKVIDSKKVIDDANSSVSMAMKMICVLFVVITLFVVCMVVMLLVKTKVIQEKRNYGIYKALGFTTKQLIVQMICTNLPIMTAGAVIGAIGSVYLADSLVIGCLSFFGIKACDLAVNPVWQVAAVAGITVVALGVTICFSMKIKKIEPAKMLLF